MLESIGEKLALYMPYLEDLRRRLYIGVIMFTVLFVGGFLCAASILKFVLRYVNIDHVTIATSSPFQFADLAMDTGFFIALIITIPYLIYSLYAFIIPALTKKEKKLILSSVPLCIGLFVAGFLYGFYVLYFALELMANINIDVGIQNIWDISEFFSQMFITATLLGLVFEFPLVLSLLIRMNLIQVQFLRDKRRAAYFLVFCLVSLLPPTDGVSLVVMSLPLVLLYELTILFNRHNSKYHVWTRN